MRALTYIAPHQMQLENRQPPFPSIAVNCRSISPMWGFVARTCMPIWAMMSAVHPMILGHEASGIVMSDGPWHAQHVAINPLVVCGACSACASGHDNLCAQRQIISMPPREGIR